MAKVVVCDNDSKVELILSNLSILRELKLIILLHSNSKYSKETSKQIEIKEFGDCREVDSEIKIERPCEKDLAYILCTSGSTGNPKLAMHTHLSLFSSTIGTAYTLCGIQENLKSDEQLSIYAMLPEAHILALMSILSTTALFGKVIYPSDRNVQKVMASDLKIVQPSILTVVPLLLKRIQEGVLKKVSEKGSIKQILFKGCYGLIRMTNNKSLSKMLFKEITEKIGGNVKIIVCAGALLDPETQEFIEITTSAKVIQGFGATEGLAVLADLKHSSYDCGKPMPGMELILRDVPELNYWSVKNQGEVCCRGPNLFEGYYLNEGETKASIDNDGFLMTGDIGEIGAVIFFSFFQQNF